MEFDYVVVGAGAAGCAVARRLSDDPRTTVLLVEYGGRALNPLLHLPKGFYYTLRGHRYLYRYETRNHEVWLRGRVAGGSTAVNGTMWMRGAPADWDGLAARGNPGWAWRDILPVYKALENHSLGASDTRGAGGPVAVTITRTRNPVIAAILESARNYGWERAEDMNSGDGERIGYTPSTIRRGIRVSAYSMVGRSAKNNANLTVATRTRADCLLFSGERVTGVRVRRAGATADVTARREVIVCAGTVETPLLLERSGIGHPDLLREIGVPVRAQAPNLGQRVLEQRGIALQVILKNKTNFIRNAPSFFATAGYDLVCQFKSAQGIPRPDVQGLFVPMALDTSSKEMKLARHPGIFFMAYPMRPTTYSSVHSTGPAPEDPPVIDARFLESAADRAAAAPVLEIARAVLGQEPVGGLIAGEEFPGPAVSGPEATVDYSIMTGTGIYHAVGSAAMGPSDDDVVDARLRVRGVSGLRIADASVLPVQVSGNTAAPAMAVGWHAADLILGGELRPVLTACAHIPADTVDGVTQRLLALSDLHVGHPKNRAIVERLPPGEPGDWLLVAGDVGEDFADIEWALGLLAGRYAKVVWVPGNHELWTRRADPVTARGAERYQMLVDACRRLGVVTPEDPYPVWTGPGGPVTVVPLFLGYDYSFMPDGATTKEEGLAHAYETGIVCSDEQLLHPDPYPSREAWCAARLAETERRLAGLDPEAKVVFLNHYPLVREPTRILRYPQFAQWCGTDRTADWHRRFDTVAVVYGHLHIPRVTYHDGVRFEEVSLGYPREWQRRAELFGTGQPPRPPWQVLPPPPPHQTPAGAPEGFRP